MSLVTNVILFLGSGGVGGDYERELLSQVNAFFPVGTGFVSVEDEHLPKGWYGGSKYLEVSLALGAFNHLDLIAFIRHLRTVEWPYPEQVQLFIKEERDDRFRIINIFDTKVL